MTRICSNGLCPNINPQPISNFQKSCKTKHGFQSRCKTCRGKEYLLNAKESVKRAVAWWKNNPEKFRINQRNYRLKSYYGLTNEKYNDILKNQGGLCAICKCQEKEINPKTKEIQNLVVDHCHKTLKVRGLLCTACNKAIGGFKDNTQTIRNAINYLEQE